MLRQARRSLRWMVTAGVALALAGVVGISSARGEPADSFAISGPSESLTAGVTEQAVAPELPQPTGVESPSGPTELPPNFPQIVEERFVEEYDPWEPFNEEMFSVNRKLDRFALKPMARVWDTFLPDQVERSLDNAFQNLGMPRRLVNSVLQLKLAGAGREVARFVLNTTIGIAGLFDVAKGLGIEKSDEDTGQTLGVYGVGPGPYLVLPFLPPLTVRDGIGFAVDAALDPFNYVIFPVGALTGIGVGDRINDRALNLEFFETIEEASLDLYSAVRNAYLQRRQKAIEE